MTRSAHSGIVPRASERPARPPIPRRHLDFDFDPASVPADWCEGDPFTTTHVAALSLLFPEGERFFVDSVKALRDRAADPALATQIAGFIGQEAMHGKAHRALNALLIAHGHASVPRIEAGIRRFLDLVRRTQPPASQLAATAALEHFTAVLAEGLLTDETMREALHPAVRALFLWHAFEESEHKAVAFDLYRAAGGSEARRIAVMAVTTCAFFATHARVHARLLRDRNLLGRPWRFVPGLARMWIRPGYFRRMIPAYLAYYRPGFHPDQRDTRALLADWRERLFGDGGQLAHHVRESEAA